MGWGDEIDSFTFSTMILGSSGTASVTTKGNFQVIMDFTWLGETYNFIIDRFVGKRAKKSIRLFLDYGDRDASTYGSIDPETDGLLVTTKQKKLIVRQVCHDRSKNPTKISFK